MKSVLVLGDVGAVGTVRHVGDEAMTAAAIRELRARGDYHFAVVSALPEETAASYQVSAIPRPRILRGSIESRLARCDAIERAARGEDSALTSSDPAWEFIRALQGADAVLVAGGGNLTSLWPSFMDERLTAARIARAAGKPVVISGQTIGPRLTGMDRDRVAELLNHAAVVGLREQASFDLASSLAANPERLRRTADDASFLPGSPTSQLSANLLPKGPFILATFQDAAEAVGFTEAIPAIADLLDTIAQQCEAEVVFLPHLGADGSLTGCDQDAHQAIAAHLQSQYRILPVQSNEVSVALVREAKASVSNRYHPAVFACANGRPAITLWHDCYTEVKFTGVLSNFAIGDLSVPLYALGPRSTSRWLADVVAAWDEDASQVGAQRHTLISQRRVENSGWWDEVHAHLTGAVPTPATWTPALQLDLMPSALRDHVARLRSLLKRADRSTELELELAQTNAERALVAAQLAALRKSKAVRLSSVAYQAAKKVTGPLSRSAKRPV